jgi:BON domain
MRYHLDIRTPFARRRPRHDWARLAAAFGTGLASGVVLLYFLDSVSGRRRRRVTLDRTAGTTRRTVRRALRAARGVGADAYGAKQRLRHRVEEPKEFDDVTLARKVETLLFRDPDVPKGKVDVNVQRGVVQLRGEVPTTDMLTELVRRARDVQGVREVESLLHLPGERAPMHQ